MAVDPKELKKVFDQFDADGSGKVDADEVRLMARSMGMVYDEDTLSNMIKEADANGDNEIDFDEFLVIVTKAIEAGDGAGLSRLAIRKQNSGPSLKWSTEKVGPGIKVESETVISREPSDGWGVQLTDVFCSSAGYSSASALLECTAISNMCYIGVVSSNFKSSNWDESLDMSSHAVAMRADGAVFRKTVNLGQSQGCIRLCPITSGCFVRMEIDGHEQSMVMQVFGPDNVLRASVTVTEMPVEITFAVAFGPSETKQIMTVVGSSTEKILKTSKASSDLWADDNIQSLTISQGNSNANTMAAVAASLG